MSFTEKIELAENTTDPEVLDQLSNSYFQNNYLTRAILNNSNTSLFTILQLSLKYKAEVKTNWAYLNCDLNELAKYAKHETKEIRVAVAEHPKCPPDILDMLSEDEKYLVKEAVAENKNTRLYTLLKLFIPLSFQVKRNPNYINCDLAELISYVEHKKPDVRAGIAAHPNCPPDVLEEPLSKDENKDVRKAVAAHPKCPPHVLEHPLSTDEMKQVRSAVARNENCYRHVLEKLSTDSDYGVRTSVAKNENCSPELLEDPLSKDKK